MAENIHPFNAGIFMFQPNHVMKRHFQNVLHMIATYNNSQFFFYEQSFLNYYFPRHRAVTYTIGEADLVMIRNDSAPYSALIHFYGAGFTSKLPRMKIYIQALMPWVNETIFSMSSTGRGVALAISSECGNTFKQWIHRDFYSKEDCDVITHSIVNNKIQ